jgi:hypothetical protein
MIRSSARPSHSPVWTRRTVMRPSCRAAQISSATYMKLGLAPTTKVIRIRPPWTGLRLRGCIQGRRCEQPILRGPAVCRTYFLVVLGRVVPLLSPAGQVQPCGVV